MYHSDIWFRWFRRGLASANDIQILSLEFHTKTLLIIVLNMSNFVVTKQNLREVFIFCVNWRKTALESYLMLLEVFDKSTTADKARRKWFRRFNNGDFRVKDKPRSGLPKKWRQRIRGFTRWRCESNASGGCRIMGVHNQSDAVRLNSREMIQMQVNKMHHKLKSRDVESVFSLASNRFKCNKKEFLHWIWTRDRKGIFYDNSKKKNTKLWPVNCCQRPQYKSEYSWFKGHAARAKSVLYTMSCRNLAISLQVIGLGYKWFV